MPPLPMRGSWIRTRRVIWSPMRPSPWKPWKPWKRRLVTAIRRRLWHAGSNGRWNAGVVIAPEIDFAVLVACNRGWKGIAAWKTRQTLKALIQAFAPKRS
jgi:hypothetical protein